MMISDDKKQMITDDLIKEMVEADLERNYKELVLKRCGFEVPKSCEL